MKVKRTSHLSSKTHLLLFLVGALSLYACGQNQALERVQQTGTITVITSNNPLSYYTYRDQSMGFEYDLAKAFADYLGVELKMKTADSWGQMFALLNRKEGDLVAASIPITHSRQRWVDFSKGYLPVRQLVIVHKENTHTKNIEDLEGKTVHVRSDTSHEESLLTLRQKGFDIDIKAHDNIATEELVAAVAQRKIEMTVAHSNMAVLHRHYYPDIRVAFPLQEPQSLGWAVRKGERTLLNEINKFFDKIRRDGTFEGTYNRYYTHLARFNHLDIKKFQERIETRLPKYEKAIRLAAEKYGFDWRLITALIYQESQFRPWAKSFSGVRGLMQLTLPTAREMGVENRLDPYQSIMGGTRYLRELYDVYDKASGLDRILIAIAAYNVGKGHVKDARRIASDMGLDPNKWASLEKTLPLLRQRRYYKKSKFGYCRGAEPVFQVQRVLTYYDLLNRQALDHKVGKWETEEMFHVEH